MTKFIIQDREAGNVIESFNSYEEAFARLEQFEEADKEEGIFEKDFYEIIEK